MSVCMRIIIDNREPEELITYIKKLIETSSNSKNILLETSNLEIGDVWIFKENLPKISNQITKPDIILERKSLNDLIASVKDGRYKEQSFRLDKYPIHNHNIFYIVEGFIERISNQTTKQIIYSSLFTLSYFKGFSVLNTQSIKQSSEIIFRFSDKLLRENKKIPYYVDIEKSQVPIQDTEQVNQESKQYSSSIKASKKSNITQDNILEIMLMQIPSVSASVAQLIGANFKSMKQLINSLEKDKNCLNNFLINGKRKIAKPTINNIITYVLNDKFEIEITT